MSVISAARTLGELSGWKLTNMEMQKILYVAQILHLGRTGKPLFIEQFEAWDYGPVVPELYHALKENGRSRVKPLVGIPFRSSTSEHSAIVEARRVTSGMSAPQLVQFAHRPGSAWERAYQTKKKHVKIANGALKAEYARDFAPSPETIAWAIGLADSNAKSPTRCLEDSHERAFRDRLRQDAARSCGRTGRPLPSLTA